MDTVFKGGKQIQWFVCYMNYLEYTCIHSHASELCNSGCSLLGNRGRRECSCLHEDGSSIWDDDAVLVPGTCLSKRCHTLICSLEKESGLVVWSLTWSKEAKRTFTGSPLCTDETPGFQLLTEVLSSYSPSPQVLTVLLSPLPFLPRGIAAPLR